MTANGAEPVRLYRLERPLGARPYWYVAGGVLALVVAVLVFVVRLSTPPGKGLPFPVFIGATVIPIMLGGAAIAYAFYLLRSPSQVQLDREGIALEGPMIRRRIAWSEIGRVETDKKEWPWLQREFRALVLYNTAGRKLATLTELIADFDDLAAQVGARVAQATGAGVGDARVRKSKRNAVLLCVAGVAFFCLSVFLGIDAWRTKTNLRLLESEGVEVDATIDRHYMRRVKRSWVERSRTMRSRLRSRTIEIAPYCEAQKGDTEPADQLFHRRYSCTGGWDGGDSRRSLTFSGSRTHSLRIWPPIDNLPHTMHMAAFRSAVEIHKTAEAEDENSNDFKGATAFQPWKLPLHIVVSHGVRPV